MENEEKKGLKNNKEKSNCACSNSQKESNKEEENGTEQLVQKPESEDLNVDPIIQGKVDDFSNDDASASSNNKENEEDFNEAQDCNISKTVSLLLLTNGSPKQTVNMILNSQCKTPPKIMETMGLEENKRLLVLPRKGKRKIEESGPSKDELKQSKKVKKASVEKNQEDMDKQKDMEADSEDMGKEGSEMETDESDGMRKGGGGGSMTTATTGTVDAVGGVAGATAAVVDVAGGAPGATAAAGSAAGGTASATAAATGATGGVTGATASAANATANATKGGFPRLTCSDELEPIFDEDDERLRRRAPRRRRDGEGRDDSGDGDGYGGNVGDHGARDDEGGDDDGGDGRAVAVAATSTPGACNSRSARDVYIDWMARVVRRRRSGPGE
ncbi:uncharacterized protein LOC131050130 [Cryptomeria japonica]|uniref:uncharacterized protein LOC131050130 n=1 Tax=Cryptomeria japonica TaxID=3369 RepID=UPI0027D9DD29|nr:uncharacterized protein LOC131050130 [Cryptomeria japonica]